MSSDASLDLSMLDGARRDGPLILPWPMPGNPGGFREFSTAAEWLDFVWSLSLPAGVPEIVAAKFRRAQKLYFLAWIDFDLIKAGELVALTTLELALQDRYGKKVGMRTDIRTGRRSFPRWSNAWLMMASLMTRYRWFVDAAVQ